MVLLGHNELSNTTVLLIPNCNEILWIFYILVIFYKVLCSIAPSSWVGDIWNIFYIWHCVTLDNTIGTILRHCGCDYAAEWCMVAKVWKVWDSHNTLNMKLGCVSLTEATMKWSTFCRWHSQPHFFKFHRCVFLRVQLTTILHWFMWFGVEQGPFYSYGLTWFHHG